MQCAPPAPEEHQSDEPVHQSEVVLHGCTRVLNGCTSRDAPGLHLLSAHCMQWRTIFHIAYNVMNQYVCTVYSKITPPIYHSIKSSHVQ